MKIATRFWDAREKWDTGPVTASAEMWMSGSWQLQHGLFIEWFCMCKVVGLFGHISHSVRHSIFLLLDNINKMPWDGRRILLVLGRTCHVENMFWLGEELFSTRMKHFSSTFSVSDLLLWICKYENAALDSVTMLSSFQCVFFNALKTSFRVVRKHCSRFN